MSFAQTTPIRRKLSLLREWFIAKLKRQQKVMVGGVVVEGVFEQKWSYANILNFIFLVTGFALGIALVAAGIALLPFSFGSSSLLAAIGVKVLVVVSTGLTVASVGKNLGRVIDTFADATKKTAEKVFAVCGFVLGVGVATALACAPILRMTFPFISNTAGLVFTRFSQILASVSFVGSLTSIGNKIGGSIDTIKNAILGLKDSRVGITTRIGNLVGCFTGLIISVTLIALHQKLAFFTVPVPNEWIQTAVTALNIYMCTGLIGRIGKHIGGAVNVVRDGSRSVLEKVVTVLWLGVSVAVTAVLARFAPVSQLKNGFVVVTKAISLLEIKSFFTVSLTGSLISFGNKFGGAVDTFKKFAGKLQEWFTAKKTATISKTQTAPSSGPYAQQIVAKPKVLPVVNKKLLPLITTILTLAASILSPISMANNRFTNAPNQIEAGQHVSTKKGEDAVNPIQTEGMQNSQMPVPAHTHNKNGTQQEERIDVQQEENDDNSGSPEPDNAANKVISPNQANHMAMQQEVINTQENLAESSENQAKLKHHFDDRRNVLARIAIKKRSSTTSEVNFKTSTNKSSEIPDIKPTGFYKSNRNTL